MELINTTYEEELFRFDEFHLMLARNFAESNANRYFDIINALNADDIKLAHRLAHNLKSNAGQLRRSSLQKAAGDIETNLENGENHVTPQQLQTLKSELKAAIDAFNFVLT